MTSDDSDCQYSLDLFRTKSETASHHSNWIKEVGDVCTIHHDKEYIPPSLAVARAPELERTIE